MVLHLMIHKLRTSMNWNENCTKNVHPWQKQIIFNILLYVLRVCSRILYMCWISNTWETTSNLSAQIWLIVCHWGYLSWQQLQQRFHVMMWQSAVIPLLSMFKSFNTLLSLWSLNPEKEAEETGKTRKPLYSTLLY